MIIFPRNKLLIPALAVIISCTRNNFPVFTHDGDCIRANKLHINTASKNIINAALIVKIDTRRRKFNSKDFCVYYEPTNNKAYSLLTIYDEVGNHRSPTWILLDKTQAVNTHLDKFEMVTDSLKSHHKIIESVNKLGNIDQDSKNELINLMLKDVRFYNKK